MLSFLEEQLLKKLSTEIYNIIDGKTNFEKILQILQNKKFISSNQKLLSLLGIELNSKKIRSFLTCIMLKHCPNDILTERKEVEEELIEKSCILFGKYLSILKNDLDNVEEFIKELPEFIQLFEAWKQHDEKKLLFILSSSYQDLIVTGKTIQEEKYENPEENERSIIWLNEIEKQKKTLEKAIFKLGGEQAIEKLFDGSFWMDIMSQDFKESVESNMKKAFREKLLNELNSDKKPYSIIKCLKEIRNLLYSCVPSREDLHDKWEKSLRIELLDMELSRDDSIKICQKTLQIYLELILELESPERNPETKLIIENLSKDTIVETLLKVYEKVKLIFQDIQILKQKLEK